jgi:hypothetical protein
MYNISENLLQQYEKGQLQALAAPNDEMAIGRRPLSGS